MKWLEGFVVCFVLACVGNVSAFSLDARLTAEYFLSNEGAKAKSKVPFLDGGPAIHESLTAVTLECDKSDGICKKVVAKGIPIKNIIEGVRSNDFPATYYNQKAVPWCKGRVLRIERDQDVACLFGSLAHVQGQQQKFSDIGWTRIRPVIVRGHYGDLQFLHAMAPDGQLAADTYSNIYAWMKFSYSVARKEVDLRKDIYESGVPEIQKFFWRGSRKSGDLMNYRFEPNHASAVAIGQMLHIAQDSFSKCHTERDSNRRVVGFLSYVHQNKSTHSSHDAATPDFKNVPPDALNPVAFGKELLAHWVDDAPWEKVEPLIQKYFEPLNGARPATTGEGCD